MTFFFTKLVELFRQAKAEQPEYKVIIINKIVFDGSSAGRAFTSKHQPPGTKRGVVNIAGWIFFIAPDGPHLVKRLRNGLLKCDKQRPKSVWLKLPDFKEMGAIFLQPFASVCKSHLPLLTELDVAKQEAKDGCQEFMLEWAFLKEFWEWTLKQPGPNFACIRKEMIEIDAMYDFHRQHPYLPLNEPLVGTK